MLAHHLFPALTKNPAVRPGRSDSMPLRGALRTESGRLEQMDRLTPVSSLHRLASEGLAFTWSQRRDLNPRLPAYEASEMTWLLHATTRGAPRLGLVVQCAVRIGMHYCIATPFICVNGARQWLQLRQTSDSGDAVDHLTKDEVLGLLCRR